MELENGNNAKSAENETPDLLSLVVENILSVCRLGMEKIPGRPPLAELKDRIRRAYHPDEAEVLLSFVKDREDDEGAFWEELDAFKRVEKDPPLALDKAFHSHLALFARREADNHMEIRLRLHERKRYEHRDVSDSTLPDKFHRLNAFSDPKDDMEKTLELIECLPQGSRGVHPPHGGFFNLGRKVAGDLADPERQLAYGLLLEEYALELVRPHTAALPVSTADYISAVAIPPPLGNVVRTLNKGKVDFGNPSDSSYSAEAFMNCLPYEIVEDMRLDVWRARLLQEELGAAFQKRNTPSDDKNPMNPQNLHIKLHVGRRSSRTEREKSGRELNEEASIIQLAADGGTEGERRKAVAERAAK